MFVSPGGEYLNIIQITHVHVMWVSGIGGRVYVVL